MDLESLHYFAELTKDLNMTQTAKRLYLSQQTLSNHIARLERYCGTALFYRKPRLSLTPAGLALLHFSSSILTQEREFKEVLSDLIDESSGVIRFGASFVRYNYMLPSILPTFSQRYPQVSLQLTDDTSGHLMAKLDQGELDVILSVRNENLPGLSSTLLLSNQLYLLVSDRLLEQYYGPAAQAIKVQSRRGAQLEDFAKLPFLLITPPNKLGTLIANCFEEAGVIPRVYLSTSYMRMGGALASQGLCAAFSTTMPLYKLQQNLAEDVNVFPVLYKRHPVSHDLYLAYYENRYHPQYTQYFIQLLREYYSQIDALDLTRITE